MLRFPRPKLLWTLVSALLWAGRRSATGPVLVMLGLLLLPALAMAQNTPPVANAGEDQTILVIDLTILQGSAFDQDNNAILEWLWSVESAPAGSSPYLSQDDISDPVFQPDVAGEYLLSLVVFDGLDWSAPDFVTIYVVPLLPPVAVATADVNRGPASLIVYFDGSQSFDPQGGLLLYQWNFGDGSAPRSEVSPTHEYGLPGTFVAKLSVQDGLGQSDDDTLTITVLPGVVVDDFEVAPFTLQATGGSDPSDQVTQMGLSSSHVIGGERQASLTVNAITGSASAQLTANGGDDAVAFSAESTSTFDLRYPISAPGRDVTASGALDEFRLDVASLSGAANVLLRVDDDAGNVGVAPATPLSGPGPFVWPFSLFPSVDLTRVRFIDFTVLSTGGTIHSSQLRDLRAQAPSNLAPVADAGNDLTAVVGLHIALQGSATDPDGDPIAEWLWTINTAPPGSTALLSDATVPDPLFQPDLSGDYMLSLVASDAIGPGLPDRITITVVDATPVPALSPASFALVATLLAGLGLVMQRGRRHGRIS